MENLEFSDKIAFCSLIISIIAMFISIFQIIIHKKSFNIEKKKIKKEMPNFKILKPLDSKAIITNSQNVILKYFLVIYNLSTRNTSIKSIKLHIIGEEKTLVVTPENKSPMLYVGENIEANKSIQGWVEFKIDKDDYYGLKIIKFIIEIEDINDYKQDVTVIFMNEEINQND